ncbi:MAG: hypothetical protein OHK0039_31520 [Bacteroidia bacterium]
MPSLPGGRLSQTENTALLRLKATSSHPIEAQHFGIRHNGQPYVPGGERFGNVRFDTRTDLFEISLPLLEGENRIQVTVRNAAGSQEAAPLLLSYVPRVAQPLRVGRRP